MDRQRNRNLFLAIGATVLVLLFAATLWEGGIKPAWRFAGATGTPLQKVQAFYRLSSQAVAQVELDEAFEALVRRVSSVEQFANVLERVPAFIPHEGGRLTWQAVQHVVMPRILFPNKPVLWDTVLVERYAGWTVRAGTSVGIGYMAEFYVDFGRLGMYVPLFLFGALIGLIYSAFRLAAPSHQLFQATVTAIFLTFFLTYEGNFAKLLGAFLLQSAVFYLLLLMAGPWLHQQLRAEGAAAWERAADGSG
jgi:hypothetical protein